MTTQTELYRYSKIYSGEFAEVYDLSPELPHTAFAFWKGFFQISDDRFIKEMKDTSGLVKPLGIKIFISDHSYLKVVSPMVLSWLHENWYKTSSEGGLLLELAIDAQNTFGKVSLQNMLDETKIGDIKTMYINNFADGKRAAKLFLREKGLM